MKTDREILNLFMDAIESDDGHYFDRGECHYCGFVDGVTTAMLWFLGQADIKKKKNSDGETRLSWNTKVNPHQFYAAEFKKIQDMLVIRS